MAERKLASIQKIIEIKVHPNADSLEIAQILGWQAIISKDDKYKAGDLVCYFEIDSFLPIAPEYEFLRKSSYKKIKEKDEEGFRIKTIKLRNALSQGLIMPLSILQGKKFPEDTRENPVYEFEEGKDVTKLLGVKKYEPYIPPHLSGEVKGAFPSFIQKTDQTRIQILRPLIDRYKGTKFSASEKVNGASITLFIKDNEFGVCSRNLELKETAENSIWKWARRYDVENKLRSLGKNIAISGEICGPGINGNTLALTYIDVYFFDAFDIDNYKYFDLNDFKDILENKLKLKTVPILWYDFVMIDNIDELIKMAIGNSKINPKVMREGLVFRPLKEIRDLEVMPDNNGRVSFKVINNEYLLEHEE